MADLSTNPLRPGDLIPRRECWGPIVTIEPYPVVVDDVDELTTWAGWRLATFSQGQTLIPPGAIIEVPDGH